MEPKKPNTETVSINIPLDAMSGTMQPVEKPSAFPSEKRDLETHIVAEFYKLLPHQGVSLGSIRSNPDDSQGQPDVLVGDGDAKTGIQVTEFRIRHRPNSEQVAARLEAKLVDEILNRVRPAHHVMVSIHSASDSENRILKLKKRELKTLAKMISDTIADDPPPAPQYPTPMDWKHVTPPKNLADRVSFISIHRLPPGHAAYCQTRETVSVTFNFHAVRFSESIMLRMAKELARKKADTTADVLLVWYRDKDFWGKGDRIAKTLAEALTGVPVKASFLLAFEDFEERKNLYRLTGALG